MTDQREDSRRSGGSAVLLLCFLPLKSLSLPFYFFTKELREEVFNRKRYSTQEKLCDLCFVMHNFAIYKDELIFKTFFLLKMIANHNLSERVTLSHELYKGIYR